MIDAYWRAANYLTIGQIYLQENPLLREPLRPEHIKPRLLGHWGTSPGLNLIYVHLNRLIQDTGANIIYLAGPGHGGPAILANVYLEGTYSEVYPQISADLAGMRRLFRQFSTPGGVPSHVSVPTPGSIHEGGELGYVLTHAFGAAFDNPDLLVVAVVGDGEAETGPLEGSWKGIKFLNPVRDGAVLPILHLNGYKISGPTVLGRSSDEEVRELLTGQGYEVFFVEGDDPAQVHALLAATLDECYTKIRAFQQAARANGFSKRPRWPVIVLRTPKGWTGPKVVDGLAVEGTFRAHQVPLANVKENAEHLKILEEWLRSYQPHQLFDDQGQLVQSLRDLAPKGELRMGANPHANGGKLLVELNLPNYVDYAVEVAHPGTKLVESTRQLGKLMRDIFKENAQEANFRLFCPDETNSNRLGNVFEVENRTWLEPIITTDDHCFRSRNYVNLIVIDKQPQLQWLNLEAAREHCAKGAGVWQWASNAGDGEPEVVLGAAGDTPTLEIVAAAWWLQQHVPDLKVRVVNVVDLMALFPAQLHPHGMDESSFIDLFTADKPVIFAFHGSPRAIHEIIHGRTKVERFHVRGFIEEGTTTTPFDMVVRNSMSRYDLCIQVIRRVARLQDRAGALIAECEDMLIKHAAYVREYFEDMPQVRDWVWSQV